MAMAQGRVTVSPEVDCLTEVVMMAPPPGWTQSPETLRPVESLSGPVRAVEDPGERKTKPTGVQTTTPIMETRTTKALTRVHKRFMP